MIFIKSKNQRRAGVIINYLSLLCLIIVWEICKRFDYHKVYIFVVVFLLLVALISFIVTYWKTRLWQFAHTPFRKLDEREAYLIFNALRYAYGIFAVVVLVTFYLYSLTGEKVSIVLAAGLVYFAHILPASIIAWLGK